MRQPTKSLDTKPLKGSVASTAVLAATPSLTADESQVTAVQPSSERGSVSRLEQQKLELEVQKLQAEIKTGGVAFEIIKALGTFATMCGIIFTVYLGIRTQRQAQQSRDDDRFEKAITRLAGTQPSERLSAITSLEQFIRGKDIERNDSALRQLLNATVIEHDPTVRSTLLDLFTNIPALNIPKASLNTALEAARDRNRATLKQLQDRFWTDHMNSASLPVDTKFDDALIGNPPIESRESLEASADIIAALIRAGAYLADLSGIYCVGCNFSTPKSPAKLEGVSFDGSILNRSVFSGALLKSARFHNAHLLGTRFYRADLSGAKITFDVPATSPATLNGEMSGNLAAAPIGPMFGCANLSGVDFSGTVLFRLVYDNPILGGSNVEFYGANLDSADLSNTQIIVAIPQELAIKGIDNSPAMMPSELIPINWTQASGPGQPTQYFNKGKYLAWTYKWLPQAKEAKQIQQAYWPDLRAAMISLYAAKNLDQAQLPFDLRAWMTANSQGIAKPISSYDCSDIEYR